MSDESRFNEATYAGKQIICDASYHKTRVVVRSSELDSWRVIVYFEDNGNRSELSCSKIEAELLHAALSRYLAADK